MSCNHLILPLCAFLIWQMSVNIYTYRRNERGEVFLLWGVLDSWKFQSCTSSEPASYFLQRLYQIGSRTVWGNCIHLIYQPRIHEVHNGSFMELRPLIQGRETSQSSFLFSLLLCFIIDWGAFNFTPCCNCSSSLLHLQLLLLSPTQVLSSCASCSPAEGQRQRISPWTSSQPYWQWAREHVRESARKKEIQWHVSGF